MKWILIVAISIFCVVGGYLFSAKYKKRVKFFNALIMLCQKLDLEINYSRERLKFLIESLDENVKISLLGVEKNYLQSLQEGKECSSSLLFKNNKNIKQSEKDVISLFFKNLGRSNIESQSKEIKNYLTRFNSMLEQANLEDKKLGKLGVKLGIICALAVLIILV